MHPATNERQTRTAVTIPTDSVPGLARAAVGAGFLFGQAELEDLDHALGTLGAAER